MSGRRTEDGHFAGTVTIDIVSDTLIGAVVGHGQLTYCQ